MNTVQDAIDEYNEVRKYQVSPTDVNIDTPDIPSHSSQSFWSRFKWVIIGGAAGVAALCITCAVIRRHK